MSHLTYSRSTWHVSLTSQCWGTSDTAKSAFPCLWFDPTGYELLSSPSLWQDTWPLRCMLFVRLEILWRLTLTIIKISPEAVSWSCLRMVNSIQAVFCFYILWTFSWSAFRGYGVTWHWIMAILVVTNFTHRWTSTSGLKTQTTELHFSDAMCSLPAAPQVFILDVWWIGVSVSFASGIYLLILILWMILDIAPHPVTIHPALPTASVWILSAWGHFFPHLWHW